MIEIRSERNPAFPGMHNPEPIARNLEATREAVLAHGAQVALATDGDADRIGVMDERGEFVDQLRMFALLAYYLLEVRGLRGPIVKSVTTTSMVLRLGELYGVPVHETGVGFKFLGPKMIETDALIAGEESGGFAFRGHLPERDGILSGLYILDLMAQTGQGAAGADRGAVREGRAALLRPHRHHDVAGRARPHRGSASLAGAGFDRRSAGYGDGPHRRPALSARRGRLGAHPAIGD